MLSLEELTHRLKAKVSLTPVEIEGAAQQLTSADVPELEKANFLRALALKGETSSEIAAFARSFRKMAIDPEIGPVADEAIDIVGTGGDHAGGFNISTLVVLTLSCCGVPVMKHGNRGITSKCGSADLFAALGLKLETPVPKLRQALEQLGFVFFFAPAFHPTFKHIAPVRKALAAEGQRTVFNILGPLVNPGKPGHVLLGVFSAAWVPRLADALTELGVRSGLAAHGVIDQNRGIDELTTATSNVVRGFGELEGIDATWQPEDHGFARSSFEELKGGDVAANVEIVNGLLAGKGPAGLVDTIAFNAATALWICGRTKGVREGVELAREQLLGGSVKAKIAATRDFYAS
jgi:anthranilate phosphoribosyltransferase